MDHGVRLSYSMLASSDPGKLFEEMVPNAFYEMVTEETNRCASQVKLSCEQQWQDYHAKREAGEDMSSVKRPRAVDLKWQGTTTAARHLFFGILIIPGITNIRNLRDIWSDEELLCN